MLLCSSAQAEDWSVAAGWSSDYRVRGVSMSNRHPSATLDLSYRGDTGWGAGWGLAALDKDADGRRVLLNASLSRGWQIDPDWSTELGLAHAYYPGSTHRRAYNADEVSATVAWRGRLTASLMASPNTTAWDVYGKPHRGWAGSAELSLRQRLTGPVALDLGLGYFELRADGSRGYPYGNIGLAATMGSMQAYLSFIGSRARQNALASGDRAGSGWVASLLWTF
ncbi:hypothetical protein BH11PSE10_BH11PSE10_18060 [soil metagenome]